MTNDATVQRSFILQRWGKPAKISFSESALFIEDHYSSKNWGWARVLMPFVNGLLFLFLGILTSDRLVLFAGILLSALFPLSLFWMRQDVYDKEITFADVAKISIKTFWRWHMPVKIHLKSGKVRQVTAPFNSTELHTFKESAQYFGIPVEVAR